MARPVVQFTRLTNAGRLADRFLACQVREFYETGFDGQARLFLLVEIVRPWLAASQIGQALIQAFTAGYRDATDSTDDLQHVEAALKRVNETLVLLSQQGETEWSGHLHAVFLLEKAGLVHVAQTGRAGAFLCREGKLSRITESEVPQSAATASTTFANITTGTLEPEDLVVLGSSEFFRITTAELLEETLRDSTPAEAAGRYARMLRQHQTRGAAATVLRAYDPRVLEQQPLLTDPEVIYLDEQPIETLGTSLKSFGRKLHRAVLAAGHQLSRANRSIDHFARTTVAPKGKALLTASAERSRHEYDKLKTQTLPAIAERMKPALKEAHTRSSAAIKQMATSVQEQLSSKISAEPAIPSEGSPTNDMGLIGKDLYTVRHYTEAPAKNAFAVRVPSLKGLTFPKLTRLHLPNIAQLVEPRRRPQFYVAVALLLTVILVTNIYILRSKQRARVTSQETIERVAALRGRLDDVKLQLALKRDAKVGAELNSIVAELSAIDLPETKQLAETAEQLLDEQTQTTRIRSPKKVATFPSPRTIARLASDVVALSEDSPTLASSPIAGELIDDRSTLPDAETAQFSVKADQADELIIVSNAGSMYRLKAPGETPETVTIDGDGPASSIAGASFFSNLYLLDPTANQIRKFPKKDAGFGGSTNFITDDTNVRDAISLAVDGSIFVLEGDGTLLKLTKGKRDGFAVKGLPDGVTLSDARAVWTNEDTNAIYVLTKSAVIELAKNGQYTRRYASPDWANLQSFVIDPAAKQGWVLNNDTVYELNLTGA